MEYFAITNQSQPYTHWIKKIAMGDEFAHHINKKVIADVCGLLGFHGIRQSASDVLSDILASCKSSQCHCNVVL